MGLNEAQKDAVLHKDGPCLVLAGPGSGKTLTIVNRVKYLIEGYKVRPEEILVVTFTRFAAAEMRSRLCSLMGKERLPVTIGTFHGIYYGILRWTYRIGQKNLLSDNEKYQILRQVIRHQKLEIFDEGDFLKDIAFEIGKIKNQRIRPEEFISEKCEAAVFRQIYREYEEQRKRRRKIDFDDMLVLCFQLFLSRPDVLRGWQKKFRYILIDEFQDINAVQYAVLRILALPENNLFVVGDDDQSIYAFRGARPRIMLDFQKDYPQAGRVELSQNYRCTPEILQRAVRLIEKNQERFPKKLRAMKDSGSPVRFLGFPSQEEQDRTLVEELERAGEARGRTAVIYRTNRDAARLAELLADRKVPFQLREKLKSPYQSSVVLDLRAYLSFARMGRKRADFYRIMNKPKRYLSRNAVAGGTVEFDRLKEYYRDKPYMQEGLRKLQLDVERLNKMDLYAAVNYIRKGMGYEEYLKRHAAENGRDWRELADQLDWFQKQMRPFSSYMELEEAIEAYERELKKASSGHAPLDAVSLLTMHASKGLEFDTVYIPDCNEGVIPHKKSGRGEQVEEERRMLYVAMTRARKELTISWVAGTEEEPGFLSRFLNDMGL